VSIKRDTVEARKALPIATGVLDYFPDALLAVAEVSRVGNEQHHPGEPLHWDKSKSTDEADALMRHLLDRGTTDTDGLRHSAKVAWRALALLQRELDKEAILERASLRAGGEDAVTPDVPERYKFSMAGGATIEVRKDALPPDFPLGRFVANHADVQNRGDWPPDTRVGGYLTCCGQTEHPLDCPQWR
jgi:dATP/dGTP diphosphohydrolase